MQSKKVAVIDYDKKFLGQIKEILLMGGYDPVVVNDAHVAVDTIVKSDPDVILLELKMPGRNGFEITDEINGVLESKRIPLIAMSDFFKEEYHWFLNLCGIKKCLKKPFQPLDVIWAIENALPEGN